MSDFLIFTLFLSRINLRSCNADHRLFIDQCLFSKNINCNAQSTENLVSLILWFYFLRPGGFLRSIYPSFIALDLYILCT